MNSLKEAVNTFFVCIFALNSIIDYLKGAEVAKKAIVENKSVLDMVIALGYMTEGGIHSEGGGG